MKDEWQVDGPVNTEACVQHEVSHQHQRQVTPAHTHTPIYTRMHTRTLGQRRYVRVKPPRGRFDCDVFIIRSASHNAHKHYNEFKLFDDHHQLFHHPLETTNPSHCRLSSTLITSVTDYNMHQTFLVISLVCKVKVKASHTRYRALGPELIPVYRQSARR